MTQRRNPLRKFFRWVRDTLDNLCDRPDHLQRLSIVGAGVSVYPAVFSLIALLVWFAVQRPQVLSMVVAGIINIVYIFLALFALVIVSLLGTIKGLSIGPRGLQVTTIADDPDVDPNTRRTDGYGGGRGGYGGGGGFGRFSTYAGDVEQSSDDELPEVDGADAAGDADLENDKSPGRITP